MNTDGSRRGTVLQPAKNRSIAKSEEGTLLPSSLETSKNEESVSRVLASKADMLKFFLDIEYVYNPGL